MQSKQSLLAIALCWCLTVSAAELPDAPQAQKPVPPVNVGRNGVMPARSVRVAHLAKYINPDEIPDQLHARDKFGVALREQTVPYAFVSTAISAGLSHGLQTNPQFGSDSAGFGERVGAAYLRQTSQAFFSDGVAASIFRQDPRYYSLGSGKILKRGLYAASRVVITKSDAGNDTVNYSELLGYAGAAALTTTYYPHVSASAEDAAEGYAVSLGGAAVGLILHEFAPDALRVVLHNRHRGGSNTNP